MWRKILRVIVPGLFIILIGVIAVVSWLNSSSFDRFVAARIDRELARLNIRAEIGQVDAHPFDLRVEIRHMRLFADRKSAPFLEFSYLEAKLGILDLFSRHFELNRLVLKQPTVSLRFDPQGRSNMEGIDLTPLRRRPEGGPTLEIGRISIDGGNFVYENKQNSTSADAGMMEIKIRPQPEATWVSINARDAYVLFNDRRLDVASFEINTGVNRQGANIERARIVTSVVDAVVSGTMRHWASPEYELSLASTVDLSHLTRDMKPGVSLSGATDITGRITGRGKQFHLTGNAASRQIGIGGVQLIAVRFQGQGGTASEEEIAGDSGEPEAKTSANDLQDFLLRGQVQLGQIRPGVIELSDFRGPIVITSEQIALNRFSASTLHGTVMGNAAIKFDGTSTADAAFQSVDLHQAVATIAKREFPVAGAVSGEARFHWPALSFKQIVGRAQVAVAPLTSDTGERLPTSGTATVDIDRRGINVLDSHVTVGTAQATVTGLIAWNKGLKLQIDATFNDLTEENRFLAVLDIDVSQLTRGAVKSLSGSGSFSGRIEGPTDRITLTGAGTIRDLDMVSGRLVSGQTNIEYHDRVVTLTNVTATFDDGSRAALALFQDELDVNNGISLKGQIHQINLSQWWDRIDFSLPVTGTATGDFDLTGLPSEPRGRADFIVVGGRVQPPQFTLLFDRLVVDFAANETGYAFRQLRLERGPNIITVSGTYQPQTRAYSLTARGINLDVSQFDDQLEQRGYPLTGRLDFQLKGAGTLAQPQLDGRFRLAPLTIAGREAGTVNGEVHTERGDIRWNIISELSNQRQMISGHLDLSDPNQPLALHADLNHLQLDPYLELALKRETDIGLTLTGQVDVLYPLVYPENRRITATFTQAQGTIGGVPLSNENPFGIKLTGNRLDISEVRFKGENTDLKMGGTIDLAPAAGAAGSFTQAQLNLAAAGTVNLQVASALYAGLFTGGLAHIQTTIRGTVKEPNVSGIADIENANVRLLNFPVSLYDGRGRVRFTQDRVLLEQFTGKANEGQVTVDGGMLAKNFKPERWRFNVRGDNVVVRYPEGLRSMVEAELTLQGSRQFQVLSGFVSVRRAEYTRDIDLATLILERGALFKGRLGVKAPPPTSLGLDIRVQAVDTVFIRNNLANAQASAWLHVGGTVSNPVISGRASVARGTLIIRNREYEINVASFDFPERPGQEIQFNIEAVGEISGYQVTIGFSGTPNRLKPTLRSEPPLPPEAVVSLIATGRADTVTQETRTLAQSNLGLATSLISEALSQQLEQRIARQRFFGINRFQIEPLLVGRGAEPTARITLGQQITKELSITYSVNIASSEEPIIILEYRLSNRFSLVGARDENGKFSLDFRVRKRF
jgi:translocation and assembly module TamB